MEYTTFAMEISVGGCKNRKSWSNISVKRLNLSAILSLLMIVTLVEIEVVFANKVINDDWSVSESDNPFRMSQEMIDLIKSVKPGGAGYNPRNDPNGKEEEKLQVAK